MLNELVNFVKDNSYFGNYTDEQIRAFFLLYKNSTLISHQGDKIDGVAVYTESDDYITFLCIIGNKDRRANLKAMLKGRHSLPAKPIRWRDEKKKRSRIHKNGT